jgi:hypothetical protein
MLSFDLSFLNLSTHGNKKPVKYIITQTGCHEIVSHKPMNKGYPQIRIGGIVCGIHRLVWEYYKGKIPKGLCVLHSCDNRICVNIKHLFLGTNFDNAQDAVSKGRNSKGEKHGRAKLTEKKITQIRFLLKKGLAQARVAYLYDVTPQLICMINSNKIWKNQINI